MNEQIRIISHSPEGIPDTGSFEVVRPGGKRYFYWDDLPGRRAITLHLCRAEALEQARQLARKQRVLI
jgi:crotonobetainyl-CoA:carnitine CoA-transferase CaiB-like acyl-CoA transferase